MTGPEPKHLFHNCIQRLIDLVEFRLLSIITELNRVHFPTSPSNLEKKPNVVMNLLEATNLANGPRLDLIRWLQGEHLLANPLRCLPCNQAMDLTVRNQEHIDGYLW